MKKSFVVFLLLSILVLSLVSSIGTSTRDKDEDNSKNPLGDSANLIAANTEGTVCTDITDRKERIKCRLLEAKLTGGVRQDDYYDDSESLPESCRNLGTDNQSNCKEFYSNIRPCYRLDGTEKHSCFRRIAGLTKASLSGEADKSKIRNYVVALLYELQERIEDKNVAGTIDSELAAEIIELITQIKEKLLMDAKKEDVKPLIQELKEKMKAIRNEN